MFYEPLHVLSPTGWFSTNYLRLHAIPTRNHNHQTSAVFAFNFGPSTTFPSFVSWIQGQHPVRRGSPFSGWRIQNGGVGAADGASAGANAAGADGGPERLDENLALGAGITTLSGEIDDRVG